MFDVESAPDYLMLSGSFVGIRFCSDEMVRWLDNKLHWLLCLNTVSSRC